MSLPSKVNKENFRLLDLSSDDTSEDLQLEIIPSRKKKVTRRERSRGITTKIQEPNISTELQCALKWAGRGTLILWLLMLTWICASLYDHVTHMKININKLSTSSDSVGDSLQVCHTAAKELRANATDLRDRLTKLELDHQELAKRVEQAIKKLYSISDQLEAAPEIRETPKHVADLQRTVGQLGSLVNGFDGALNTARKQAVSAASGVEEVKTLLHQLEARTNETIANVSANVRREDEIKEQIKSVNSTLDAKLEELKGKIEEISKPVSTAATSTTVTTPSTTSTTTTTTTTTTPPGPPAKPSVLQ